MFPWQMSGWTEEWSAVLGFSWQQLGATCGHREYSRIFSPLDSLEGKGSKAVTDIENNVIHHESDVIDETMDIGETKPELAIATSNFITKVKLQIIKVEPCVDDVNRRLKEAIVVLPKLSDETIRKYIK